ncbi:hypothetical protein SAMN04487936_103188 [Halobacillus dabanensis]|uniref:Uncharacterized protein n=1 Tax=Halobacillus dabanensis TaxID=240302 RepID=A0A1I3T2R4_HALDA|nr:hypothetical protein SAMN04487936_103188 [Halobacillus dabanensis]
MLGVRGDWEATRFPVGERRASSDCVLRDLAYLLLPRESPSFPTTPSNGDEKRTPLPRWDVFPSLIINIKRSISNCDACKDHWGDLYYPLGLSIQAEFPRSGFETLIWQRGGGEWRDACGKRVLGETPQGLRRLTARPTESEPFPGAPRAPQYLETESSRILPVSGTRKEHGWYGSHPCSFVRVHITITSLYNGAANGPLGKDAQLIEDLSSIDRTKEYQLTYLQNR